MSAPTLDVGLGTSRRHLQHGAGQVCILVRHTTTLVVAALSVCDRDLVSWPTGHLLLAAFGAWSVYRLLTRSQLWQFTAADFGWVLAVGVSVGVLVDGPSAFESISAPQVITSIAVATFVLQAPPAAALPMTAAIAVAYAWGSAQVIGWHRIGELVDLLYLFASWATASLIRLMIWRLADAVDRARADRQAAEVARSVSAARRHFDRDQLALLHDTAAATLLMVGQQATVSHDRLAAQAARDLALLEQLPAQSFSARMNLVAALRTDTAHLDTPVRFLGTDAVWLRGQLAAAVVSAAREVTNNVDRHAGATLITIDVRPDRVIISDDGVGFTPGLGIGGHGIRASIVGRMNRAGGSGSVRSAPAQGTVAELSWPAATPNAAVDTAADADRLIARIRTTYTLAMTGYAIASLIAAMPPMTTYAQHGPVQIGLALTSGLCALAAVPAVLWGEHRPAWGAAMVLAVVAIVQPGLLSGGELLSDANWSQPSIGFCLLPLLTTWPTGRAAVALCSYWLVPAAITLIRVSGEDALVFLGLSLAGSLVPQLFASLFSTWATGAAQAARIENDTIYEVATAERIAEAIQADYHKRYAEILTEVVPLLRALSDDEPITDDIRRRARAESRRLRTLFDQLQADHPLMFELRAVVETAEDRGVEVAVHFDTELPDLEPHELNDIVQAVERLIALAANEARLVVTATGAVVDVSLVCESPPKTPDAPSTWVTTQNSRGRTRRHG